MHLDVRAMRRPDQPWGDDLDHAVPLGHLQGVDPLQRAIDEPGRAARKSEQNPRDVAEGPGSRREQTRSRGCGRPERRATAPQRETGEEHALRIRGDDPTGRHGRILRLHIDVETRVREGVEGLRERDETAAVRHDALELAAGDLVDGARVSGDAPEVGVVEQHNRPVARQVAVGLDVRDTGRVSGGDGGEGVLDDPLRRSIRRDQSAMREYPRLTGTAEVRMRHD